VTRLNAVNIILEAIWIESPSFLRLCVPDCHNTLNRILRRVLKATITLKEAENAVLKRDKLRSAIEEIHAQDINVGCYVYSHKITPNLLATWKRWREFKPSQFFLNFVSLIFSFFLLFGCCFVLIFQQLLNKTGGKTGLCILLNFYAIGKRKKKRQKKKRKAEQRVNLNSTEDCEWNNYTSSFQANDLC